MTHSQAFSQASVPSHLRLGIDCGGMWSQRHATNEHCSGLRRSVKLCSGVITDRRKTKVSRLRSLKASGMLGREGKHNEP